MKINSIFFQIVLAALMALLCASCGHKKSVTIVNHNKSVYNKSNGLGKNKYAELKSKKEEAAAVGNRGKEENSSLSNREVEVNSGDTLYSISKKYQ